MARGRSWLRLRGGLVAALIALLGATQVASAHSASAAPRTQAGGPAPLLAGAGRADITPPTGYYMMGWVRSDAVATGQHTRLYARAIVLEEGGRKVALVAEDLNGIAGGMLADAARLDADLGFSEQNVLDSASHTHAAPSGYYNFSTYNTVFMTVNTPTSFNLSGAIDPQLYAFEVRQLALAIRRADSDLAPAAVGWGFTTILGLTANRSLEAHLADFGIHEAPGTGSVAQDPGGYPDTIDPEVNVLRVDHIVDGRHLPIGMWSTFADHGTVNKYTFHYYNADHHGAATRLVEAALRAGGDVPAGQDVVNVYGNSDEGDMSAGLTRSGPADADHVGEVEAAAFLDAWHQAASAMTTQPSLDLRWTRVCFCGQRTALGATDTRAIFGLSEFTGSEEGRGPLYDITHVSFEGDHLPVGVGPQGDKIQVTVEGASVPKAVPLMALQIADRMIVSMPGEMTVEMGRRVRGAVLAATAPGGVTRVVISGLANEYLDYLTTPEEYGAQHYEGGVTVYGTYASVLLEETVTDLAHRLVAGLPAPAPYAYDPRNKVAETGAPFPTGPAAAQAVSQPADAHRLEHPAFSWQGGVRGEDRPVDAAFVTVQHRDAAGAWHDVDSDLGLDTLWSVDANGVYSAEWEVPLDAPTGAYRFRVTANHYTLQSSDFAVSAMSTLTARVSSSTSGSALELGYPAPVTNVDLTARPDRAAAAHATVLVNGTPVDVVADAAGRFAPAAQAGDTVEVKPGAAQDGFGNSNSNDLVWHVDRAVASSGGGGATSGAPPANPLTSATLPSTSRGPGPAWPLTVTLLGLPLLGRRARRRRPRGRARN